MIHDSHNQSKFKNLPTITTVDGRQFSVDQAGLVTGRREPREAPQADQIRAAVQFFELAIEADAIQKTFTINSYRAKHCIEKLVARYCCNGAAIVGAHLAGVPIEKSQWDLLNCFFPIQRRWYRSFVDDVQGNGFRLFDERAGGER
jgi:hypothetical protein